MEAPAHAVPAAGSPPDSQTAAFLLHPHVKDSELTSVLLLLPRALVPLVRAPSS